MKTARIALLLAVALMLLSAVPVAAGAPLIEDSIHDSDGVWGWAPCDFTVYEHEVLRVRTATYFDKAGNPVEVVMHFHGGSTFRTEENPGVELKTDTVSATFRINLVDETTKVTGLTAHLTIPGYGAVLLRSGLWSEYPFGHDAGKDTLMSEADVQAFCSYLAGN